MNDRLVFFDTNVLVYTDDTGSPEKQQKAIELVSQHLGTATAVFSLQVLQEYFFAATRKLKVSAEQAQEKIELLARGRIARINEGDLIRAIEIHRLRGISFWDSLIVQAALVGGCSVIYSEDELGGGRIGNLRVINPFREDEQALPN